MGILQVIPKDQFFSEADRREFRPGQFCYVPVPHLRPIPRILDVERQTSEEHDNIRFTIRDANQERDFKKNDRDLPIMGLNLRSNEELLIHQAKRRPCVIISSEVDRLPELDSLLRGKGKRHYHTNTTFVVPLNSIESDESRSGFPMEMAARIRCLRYRRFFYIPKHPELRKESIARVDRVWTVEGNSPVAISPIGIALAEESLSILLAMVVFCLTGEEDKYLRNAREILRDYSPETGSDDRSE